MTPKDLLPGDLLFCAGDYWIQRRASSVNDETSHVGVVTEDGVFEFRSCGPQVINLEEFVSQYVEIEVVRLKQHEGATSCFIDHLTRPQPEIYSYIALVCIGLLAALREAHQVPALTGLAHSLLARVALGALGERRAICSTQISRATWSSRDPKLVNLEGTAVSDPSLFSPADLRRSLQGLEALAMMIDRFAEPLIAR